MPVIPSFSFGNSVVREQPGATSDANAAGQAHASPQPSSSTRHTEGTARSSRRRSSDADGTDASDRSHSTGSSSRASHHSQRENNGGTTRAALPSRRRSTEGNREDGDAGEASDTASRSRSTSVPLFTGREEEDAAPGRRFMNLHRRARRELARSNMLSSLPDIADTRAATAGYDADHRQNTERGRSEEDRVAPQSTGEGALTGASLRRGQYTTSSPAQNPTDSGADRVAPRRASLGSQMSESGAAEAHLGASDSAVRAATASAGRRSDSGPGTSTSLSSNFAAEAAVMIVVAPAAVQLTTSEAALRRQSQQTGAAHTAPTLRSNASASEQRTQSTAASFAARTPTTPLRRGGDGSVAQDAAFTRQQHLHAAAVEHSARSRFSTSDYDTNSTAADAWQLPVLTTAMEGNVARRTQQRSVTSLLSSSSGSSRSAGVAAVSRGQHSAAGGSQFRSASLDSNSEAGGLRSSGHRSSREVSWLDEVPVSQHEHTAPAPPAVSRAQQQDQRSSLHGAMLRSYPSTSPFHHSFSDADSVAAAGRASAGSSLSVLSQPSPLLGRVTTHITATTAAGSPRRGTHSPQGEYDFGNAWNNAGGGADATSRNVAAQRRPHRQETSSRNDPSISSREGAGTSPRHRRSRGSLPASPVERPALIPTLTAAAMNTPAPPSQAPSVAAEGSYRATNATAGPPAVQLPTAKDGLVLMNFVGDVPAQGELYRLLRVYHRHPLRQFPEALRGPALAVRLPGDSSGDDDEEGGEMWSEWDEVVARQRRQQQQQQRHPSNSGSSVSELLEDGAAAHARSGRRRHHHSRQRGPHAAHRGRSSRSLSASSSASSSSSVAMVEVNASNPRDLFTRLVADPADRTVEVVGLPSVASSNLSNSPRQSRRTGANRGSLHASRHHTPGSHGEYTVEGTDSGSPASNRFHGFPSGRSLPATASGASAAGGNAASATAPSSSRTTASACQAEVVANGFFNAEVRSRQAQDSEEQRTAAEAAYGQGGYYYTAPLIPTCASPPSTSGRVNAARASLNAAFAGPVSPAKRSVGTQPLSVAGSDSNRESMELLPRLLGAKNTSSRIRRGSQHSFSASGSGTAAPLLEASRVESNSRGETNSQNAPPPPLLSQLLASPEPPRAVRARPDMMNPRSLSMRSFDSPNAPSSARSKMRAFTDTPQRIADGAASVVLQSSGSQSGPAGGGVSVDDGFAPMARVSAAIHTTPPRRSDRTNGNNG